MDLAVDLHRHGNLAVPKDLHSDPGMHVESDQKPRACAPGVMHSDVSDPSFPAPGSELPVEVTRLIRSAGGAGEYELRVVPGVRDPRRYRRSGHPRRYPCCRRSGSGRPVTRRAGVPGHRSWLRPLLGWLSGFGPVRLAGIERTGSYGAGLARYATAAGIRVVEVDRSDRRDRRRAGKSDPLDAVSAARAAQSGRARGRRRAGMGRWRRSGR